MYYAIHSSMNGIIALIEGQFILWKG